MRQAGVLSGQSGVGEESEEGQSSDLSIIYIYIFLLFFLILFCIFISVFMWMCVVCVRRAEHATVTPY